MKDRNKIGILGIQVCFTALELFVSVFLVAKLFTATGNNLGAVGLFYIVNYIMLFAAFILSSYISKRYSRTWVVRAATVFFVGTICLVIFLQNQIGEFYLLLAAAEGFAVGIYWGAMNMLTGQVLGGKKMASYQAWYIGTTTAVSVIFPFTLGAVIEFVSFAVATLITLGLGILLVAFTILLQEQRTDNTALSMRKYISVIRQSTLSKPVSLNFWLQLLAGIYSAVSIAITVLIVIIYKDNFSLGSLTSIFAASGILVLVAYKAIKPEKIKSAFYYACCVIPVIAAVGILFEVSPFTLILLQAGFVSKSVINMERGNLQLDIMNKLGQPTLVAESILHTELAYFIARMISMGIIIAAWYMEAFVIFQILVFVQMALLLLCGLMMRRWYRYAQS